MKNLQLPLSHRGCHGSKITGYILHPQGVWEDVCEKLLIWLRPELINTTIRPYHTSRVSSDVGHHILTKKSRSSRDWLMQEMIKFKLHQPKQHELCWQVLLEYIMETTYPILKEWKR
jgi:hypothetical protein